jgi:hypothetical protein
MSYQPEDKVIPSFTVTDRSRIRAALPMVCAVMPNPGESVYPKTLVPIAPDRRQQDRILTRLPIRIVAVEGSPVFYPAECTDLSYGGIGFETAARLEVGKVIEFEFVQVVDEPVRYWVRILFRDNNRYGGYYVDDDGTDIRAPN